MNKKIVWKMQLKERLLDYFRASYKCRGYVDNKLSELSTRKLKRICRILGLSTKYYDTTPSEADYIVSRIVG